MLVKILIGIVAVSAVLLSQYYFKSEEGQTQYTSLSSIEHIDSPQELFNQGSQHFGGETYNLTLARAAFTRQLMLNPTFSEFSWYRLGRIDFVEGEFRSALYKFNEQISYFGDAVPNVYYMLGLTYGYLAQETGSEEDWQQAEESFLTFMRYAPTSPWPRVDLAWVYFAQGNYEAMVPILEEGLQYEPDQPWLLNTYGLALLNTGETERARAIFMRAAEEAEKLTVEDWGEAYSGNDPQTWESSLEIFRNTIKDNLALTE